MDFLPFSAREALLGAQTQDADRVRRANRDALWAALRERFFDRAQAIQRTAARGRTIAILSQDKLIASAPLGASIRAEDVMLDVPADTPTDLLV